MGRRIKLSEEELHNVIKEKVLEAIENIENIGKDLGYAPAIGNKKRGPGDGIKNQMRKRENRKLDEEIDEAPIYRRLPNGDLDYEGDDGIGGFETGVKDVELGTNSYAFAFEQIYGRVPGNLEEIIEKYGLPEEVTVRFSLSMYDYRGDYNNAPYSDATLKEWDIEDPDFDKYNSEMQEIIRKAVSYYMDDADGNDLVEFLNESKKTIRLSESQLHRMIVKSIKKILKEEFVCPDKNNAVPLEVGKPGTKTGNIV